MPQQQGAQHHQPALGGQQFWRRDVELFKNELCHPVEGQNLQPGEAGNFPGFEQLAFELEGGLFGRKQNERRAIRRLRERGADFRKAAEGFAAAGGAEEEARLHAGIFPQRREGAKEFLVNNKARVFYFLSGELGYDFPPLK